MATNEQIIWEYLRKCDLSEAGTAGLMGNLFAESGLIPTNLQNSFEKKLGYSDSEYTNAVDNGSYNNFIKDKAGYGLAQWTFWSRKQDLLNYAKLKNKSIGDLQMQLDFLMSEFNQRHKNLLNFLKTTNSVSEASNQVLLQFERPADQSVAVQQKRASYSQLYYNKYSKENQPIGGNSVGYTNSPLVNYTKISPNKTSPRNHAIDTITIHCVVGQCSIEALGNIFAPSSKQASSNYGIGPDGRIGMYVEEKDRSWCSSSASNDNRAITIEVASDTTDPYAVTKAAYESLIKLVADICKRNGIKKLVWSTNKNERVNHLNGCNMTVHRDYANKSCPGEYLYSRHGDIANRVNAILNGNSGTIVPPVEEEEEMTQEQFNTMMNSWIAEQAKKDPSTWSQDSRTWAEKNGFIQGDTEGKKMYKKFITREELVAVLYRALHRNIID